MEKDIHAVRHGKVDNRMARRAGTGNNGLLLSNNNGDYGVDGRTAPFYLRNGGDHGSL
ncbi:MAG: hypothetical protein V8T46_02800 [Sutterella seckii]